MEQLIQGLAIVAIFFLIIIIAVYIVEAIILNNLNKLMYGKGTALAWIPICNIYLLGKLTFNKILGWILVGCLLLTSTITTTVNGVEKTFSILPASIIRIVSTIYSIATLGLFIYAIVKYVQLKKKGNTQQGQTTETTQTATEPNVGQPFQPINQTVSEPVVESVPTFEQPNQTVQQTDSQVQDMSTPQPQPMNQPLEQSAPTFEQASTPVVETPVVNEQPANTIVEQTVSEPIEQPAAAFAQASTPVAEETPAVNEQPANTIVEQTVSEPIEQPAAAFAQASTPVVEETPVVNEQPAPAFAQQTVSEPVSQPVDQTPIIEEQPMPQPTSAIPEQSTTEAVEPIEMPTQNNQNNAN